MAARENDDFDVLKFFIAVMVLLTTFVGGYALYLRSQVDTLSLQIRGQVRALGDMKKLVAEDKDFREWIAHDRESHSAGGGRTPTDFKALLVDAAPRFNINYSSLSQEGAMDHRVAVEIPFRMSIEGGCRIEDLTRYLAFVEESWGGAKAREIPMLEWDEKKNAWKATVVISIFKAS